MEDTKMISVVGKEIGDLAYFLCKTMEEKKFRVLCIDNSCSHDLFSALKKADEEADYVEHGQTVYMRNKTIDEEYGTGAFEKFDVVIVNHGLNIDYELVDMSDFTILQTDYVPANIAYINDYIDTGYLNQLDKEKFAVVFRDRPSAKVTELYVLKQLGIDGLELEFVVNYDEANYNAYINFCYNGIQAVKGITSEYKHVLTEIKNIVFGKEITGLAATSQKLFAKKGAATNDHSN